MPRVPDAARYEVVTRRGFPPPVAPSPPPPPPPFSPPPPSLSYHSLDVELDFDAKHADAHPRPCDEAHWRCSLLVGYDFYGRDLAMVYARSTEECNLLCVHKDGCRAYSFDLGQQRQGAAQSRCWLKSGAPDLRLNPNRHTGRCHVTRWKSCRGWADTSGHGRHGEIRHMDDPMTAEKQPSREEHLSLSPVKLSAPYLRNIHLQFELTPRGTVSDYANVLHLGTRTWDMLPAVFLKAGCFQLVVCMSRHVVGHAPQCFEGSPAFAFDASLRKVIIEVVDLKLSLWENGHKTIDAVQISADVEKAAGELHPFFFSNPWWPAANARVKALTFQKTPVPLERGAWGGATSCSAGYSREWNFGCQSYCDCNGQNGARKSQCGYCCKVEGGYCKRELKETLGPELRTEGTNTFLRFDHNGYVALRHIYVPSDAYLRDVSVEVWFRTSYRPQAAVSADASRERRRSACLGATCYSFADNWAFLSFDRTEKFAFFLRSNDGRLHVGMPGQHGYDYYETQGGSLADGAWHHAVATLDEQGQLYLYRDGLESPINAHPGRGAGKGGKLRFGFVGTGSRAPFFDGPHTETSFNGDVAQLRLHHGVLSPLQVRSNFLLTRCRYVRGVDCSAQGDDFVPMRAFWGKESAGLAVVPTPPPPTIAVTTGLAAWEGGEGGGDEGCTPPNPGWHQPVADPAWQQSGAGCWRGDSRSQSVGLHIHRLRFELGSGLQASCSQLVARYAVDDSIESATLNGVALRYGGQMRSAGGGHDPQCHWRGLCYLFEPAGRKWGSVLHEGTNELVIAYRNTGGPGGLYVSGEVRADPACMGRPLNSHVVKEIVGPCCAYGGEACRGLQASCKAECDATPGCAGATFRHCLEGPVEFPDAQRSPKNVVEEFAPGIGGWGGRCTCPNGETYEVGDLIDYCGSLACTGGTAGPCNRHDGPWSRRKVSCAHPNALHGATRRSRCWLVRGVPGAELELSSHTESHPDAWGYLRKLPPPSPPPPPPAEGRFDGACALSTELDGSHPAVPFCVLGATVERVVFASYGMPWGGCGQMQRSWCHAAGSEAAVRRECLGRRYCKLWADSHGKHRLGDPCPGWRKWLKVEVVCSQPTYELKAVFRTCDAHEPLARMVEEPTTPPAELSYLEFVVSYLACQERCDTRHGCTAFSWSIHGGCRTFELCTEASLRWNRFDSSGADGKADWWVSFARVDSASAGAVWADHGADPAARRPLSKASESFHTDTLDLAARDIAASAGGSSRRALSGFIERAGLVGLLDPSAPRGDGRNGMNGAATAGPHGAGAAGAAASAASAAAAVSLLAPTEDHTERGPQAADPEGWRRGVGYERLQSPPPPTPPAVPFTPPVSSPIGDGTPPIMEELSPMMSSSGGGGTPNSTTGVASQRAQPQLTARPAKAKASKVQELPAGNSTSRRSAHAFLRRLVGHAHGGQALRPAV